MHAVAVSTVNCAVGKLMMPFQPSVLDPLKLTSLPALGFDVAAVVVVGAAVCLVEIVDDIPSRAPFGVRVLVVSNAKHSYHCLDDGVPRC